MRLEKENCFKCMHSLNVHVAHRKVSFYTKSNHLQNLKRPRPQDLSLSEKNQDIRKFQAPSPPSSLNQGLPPKRPTPNSS
jgi:hypothetical protein